MVYAPDKTEAGTFEKRLSVRPKHVEMVQARRAEGLVCTPINPLVPLAPTDHLFGGIRCRWMAFEPRIAFAWSRPEDGGIFVHLRS
jgi:hypothetical protein